jgi:hypothetical protein
MGREGAEAPLKGLGIPAQPEAKKHNNVKQITFFRRKSSQRLKWTAIITKRVSSCQP